MALDIATQVAGMAALQTRQAASIAVMRQTQKMQQAVVDMLDKSVANLAAANAPAGTGRIVDKRA